MPGSEIILLAEDNADDVVLIQSACASAGIHQTLRVVDSGLEAIRYLGGEGNYANRSAHPFPFLLLLDLGIPIRDGFAVLEWLREHPTIRSRLTVIVLTGYEGNEVRDRSLHLGAQLVLTKPLSFQQLVAMMLRLKQDWINSRHPPS